MVSGWAALRADGAERVMRPPDARSKLFAVDGRGSTEGRRPVLIVDDDADIARFVQVNVESEGYRCVIAGDGVEALSQLASEPFDAVLTGLMLPRMGGFELLRRIRADPRTVDLPIAIVSARTTMADKKMGLGLSADDYLIKPFDPAELLRHLSVLRSLPRGGIHRDKGFEPSSASDDQLTAYLDGICIAAGCRSA
jgi:DNA-binding response OmpR family regulator